MIPPPVIALVAKRLSEFYSRSEFENLFYQSGTKVESPGGIKLETVSGWLREIDRQESDKALNILGYVLRDFMESTAAYGSALEKSVEELHGFLHKYGLRYVIGGNVVRTATATGATATVQTMLRDKDFPAMLDEFKRATDNVSTKPREAASAAANILEAICKEYIVQHPALQMPAKKDLGSTFTVVRKDLGFDPSAVEDDDLKAILTGLISIVTGIAALRTHASSAHAQSTTKRAYRLTPRHAGLAVHAAHAIVAFIFESWEAHDAKAHG
jgi:Abortive infection C-terminus